MPKITDQLDAILVQTAAHVARVHSTITLEKYEIFLDTMYHYTFKSRERLERAASLCKEPDLQEFFSTLAQEESSHYVLAEADLKALGKSLLHRPKPDCVADFENYWNAIEVNPSNEFLGALYVLEGVGQHLKETAAKNMGQLGLTRLQARFVLVHLHEDEAHSNRTRELCLKYSENNPQSMLDGALQASRHWTAIMCEGFQA